jgi:translation initiation factor 5A
MVLKLISATEIRPGTILTIEKDHYTVKTHDTSKAGRHGPSKVRFEAVSIFDGKKKVVAVPGHERFEVPLIKKLKAQVLSVRENNANIMDLETFETFDAGFNVEEAGELKENDNVEYWDVEGKIIIKRKI